MKNKILFLINDLSGGGAERALVNIVNNLDKTKYDITCKTLFNRGVNRKELEAHINYEYFFPVLIRGYSKLSRFIPARLMYKLIVKKRYDLEISFLEGVCTKVLSGSENRKIAWVHTEFNSNELYSEGFRNKMETDRAYLKYDSIVCVSKDVSKSFGNYLNIPLKVLYNPLNIILDNKISYNFNSQFFNIVTVGRLTAVKGYNRLINCISNLPKKYKVRLYIIGEGEERKNLEEQIRLMGLEDIIILLGYFSKPLNIVKNADLFICSSYREGLSTVVGEAISLNVPVLTTNCSGMKELLMDGRLGCIVENEEEALFDGIINLLENKHKLEQYKENLLKYNNSSNGNERIKLIEDFIDGWLNK